MSSTPAILPLKAAQAVASPVLDSAAFTSNPTSTAGPSSTISTLRSLYSRAARAFLHRDVELTHSLITSALPLIPPPPSSGADGHDPFADHRRKWDILRITLEVTVYTSPPDDLSSLPESLRSNAVLSPASLITSLHARSVQFFEPEQKQPFHRSYLPWQVLVTLILASVKAGCPDVGKSMVEDWLARRGSYPEESNQDPQDAAGYEKVLEAYCLNVLPALEEWDYAKDFLQYENELDPNKKELLSSTLSSQHAQAQYAARPRSPPPTIPASSSSGSSSASSSAQTTPRPSRSPSPTPSSHSSTSTHTAVPLTPKARPQNGAAHPNGVTPLSPTPIRAQKQTTASSAATSRTVTPLPGAQRPVSKFRVPSGASHGNAPSPANGHVSALVSALSNGNAASSTSSTPAPGAFALIRALVQPYMASIPAPRLVLAFVLCALLPMLSLVFSLRRRRLLATRGPGGSQVAEDVRRRLGGVQAGLWRRLWEEVGRAVGDTVRMGGRGLV